MKLFEYLSNLWFSKKESEIYLALYKLWTQPASIVAKYVQMERTYVYKAILSFVEKDLISVTEKNWVKHFFIPDILVLKKYLQNEKNRFMKMEDDFNSLETELLQYNTKYSSKLPKINIRDWMDWIRYLYEDIFDNIIRNWYISIKMFASNTIMSQSGWENIVKTYSEDFFKKMQEKNIHIETFLWNWLWIMESLGKTSNISEIEHLPASNSSIQIFIIWKTVYIIIFKDIPFWIKFDSEDLARTLHFLFEHLRID
ncbi:MAG: hypothetical protein ACD_3C00165G0006 [uncultured bacterium (gcode 4)]|uniref:Transcription regulator TrmB N-terminal domain-containing protein n=1 Tax=uncultured bacterium (gcode 4) TaxID=1234023 RepID=K2G0P3_9BACT|nr:MAG: hypothetical protein ACD_3C00165G0006 [uncultured bacterium (gcode 4)]